MTLFNTPQIEMQKAALVSHCQRYRYWLTRTWDKSLPVIIWMMLNPSVADASLDDPTIRKCVGFSKRWGGGGILVLNLFALRTTDPRKLKTAEHPIASPLDDGGFQENANDGHIWARVGAQRLIVAWGCDGAILGRDRQVMELLKPKRVECLDVTKDGFPRHPLYVPYDVSPQPFTMLASGKGGA